MQGWPPLLCRRGSGRRVVVVDGYEQLGWWARRRLKGVCRRAGWGVLVTAHDAAGLPGVYATRSDAGLASPVVSARVGEAGRGGGRLRATGLVGTAAAEGRVPARRVGGAGDGPRRRRPAGGVRDAERCRAGLPCCVGAGRGGGSWWWTATSNWAGGHGGG